MRPTSRILFGAFIALCWSGLATANPPDPTTSLDPSVFREVSNIQLDSAFEEFVSQDSGRSIRGLSGPSSMDCDDARTKADIETCVVTTRAPRNPAPAALAQH